MQDDITERVVAAVEPHLYAEEGFRAARQQTDSIDAWGLVVRALNLINKVDRAQNEEAQRAAAPRDRARARLCARPRAARLGQMVGRALLLVRASPRGLPASRPRTRRTRWRSIRSTRGRAWCRGCASSTLGQHDRALGELRVALNLNPSFALGHMAYGWALLRAGQFDEAIAETRQAMRLSAARQFLRLLHGDPRPGACSARERFAEALPFLRTSVAAFAEYSGHYNTLISCCGHLGLIAEAQEYIARRNRIGPPLRLSRAAREPAAVRASRRVHRGAAQGRRAGVGGATRVVRSLPRLRGRAGVGAHTKALSF